MLTVMRVLALDTTVPGGSAALVEGTRVLVESPGDPARSHGEQLPGLLLHVLESARFELRDVDRFAVASGPGSFTGLRIGIATVQGLATVVGRRVVAVPALEALGHLGSLGLPAGTVVAAWMDARRRDVFSALYRIADAPDFAPERLAELEPPSVGDPAVTLARWDAMDASPVVFAGDGALAYATMVAGRGRVLLAPALAAAVGLAAVHSAQRGHDVEPGGVQPLYVRRPDAELARDRPQPSGPACQPGSSSR